MTVVENPAAVITRQDIDGEGVMKNEYKENPFNPNYIHYSKKAKEAADE